MKRREYQSQRWGGCVLLGLLALLSLTACGGKSAAPAGSNHAVTPPASLFAQLPPLPSGDAPTAAKAGSAAQTGYIGGLSIYSGDGYTVSGGSTVLPSQPNKVAWAIFSLNLNGGTIQQLQPNLTVLNGECWVALSDYGSGRWKFLDKLSASGTINVPAGTYNKPNSSFFMLLLTYNGSIAKHNYTLVQYDDGAAQGAQISGTVTDENSLPVGGVPLQITPGFIYTYTDAQGHYSISVGADDTYTVEPQQGGYTFNPVNTMVTIAGGASQSGIDFQGTSFDIRGTVMDGANPLGGVTVKLVTDGRTTTTLADGTYEFQGVNPGPDTVVPKLAGYSFIPANIPVDTTAGDANGNDFAATGGQPTFKVSGFVIDVDQVAGVVGATVRLDPDYIYVQTGANGYYEFTGLAPDIYTVNAFDAGFDITPKNMQVPVINLDSDNNNFNAQKLYKIDGNIQGSGAFPLAGITVTLSPGGTTTQTDSAGNFAFYGLHPNTYTVTPSHPLYTFNPLNAMANIAGADASAGNFTGALTGTVTYNNYIGLSLSNSCLSCHSNTASIPVDPYLRDYNEAKVKGAASNIRVQAGTMPPGNPLSEQSKELWAKWISDGLLQ